jgi:hypothetical protein
MLKRGMGIAGLSLALLGAPPASAGDEFEDGFKDELGRIAAHEAVRGGRQILANILFGGPPAVVAAPAPPPPAVAYYPAEPYYPAPVYHEHHHYYHYPAYGYAPGYYEYGRPYGRGGHHHHHRHKHHRGCRH